MIRILTSCRRFLPAIALIICSPIITEASVKQFRIGFFEGGVAPHHALLRAEFKAALRRAIPEDYEAIYVPSGFKSASWNRDSSKVKAAQLASEDKVDIIVTLGPWVVEDLLEAGFSKPIVALHRFSPALEGLLEQNGKPIAKNLTVQTKPRKIGNDLAVFASLVKIRKLGFLFFPSGDESDSVLAGITTTGKNLGFEVVTAAEYDNKGTFAFFKSYAELKKSRVDALYVGPLSGLDAIRLGEFFKMLLRDRLPVFTYEGDETVYRGALASNASLAYISEARFNAAKTIEIMKGKTPADLPVIFSERPSLSINQETAATCKVELPRHLIYDTRIIEAPLSEDTEALPLSEAIDRAVVQNPGFLARYDALEAAVQAGLQARSAFLPQVGLDISGFRLDDNSVNNSHGWLDKSGYSASIFVDQKLFSRKDIQRAKAAAQKKELRQNQLIQSQLDLELGVTLAYLNLIEAKQNYVVQSQNRDHINRYYETARGAYQLGETDTADMVRLENEYDQSTIKLIEAKYEADASLALFNALMNLPPDVVFAMDTGAFSIPVMFREYRSLYPLSDTPSKRQQVQEYLINRALADNASVQEYSVKIKLKNTLLAANRARYLPEASVGFRYSYADRLADYPNPFREENDSWSLFGRIELQLFNGFDRKREGARIRAELSQTEYIKDSVSLAVMGDLSRLFIDVLKFSDQVPAALRIQKTARSHLEFMVDDYESGKTSVQYLLDAQQNALAAEVRLLQSRFGYFRSLAGLVHDLGWSTTYSGNTFDQRFINEILAYAESL